MRQPPEQLVTAVLLNDRLADDGAELHHPLVEPRGDASAVEGKIGAAGSLAHEWMITGERTGNNVAIATDGFRATNRDSGGITCRDSTTSISRPATPRR